MAALLVVAVRLSFVLLPAAPDEGGYLTVAQQWRGGGSSLYGDYWVDRPPLLISLFQIASALGGLVTLRVIGCLAAAVTVLAVAAATRRAAGDRAATWAAAVAAALLISPLAGSPEVNGELLAGPFVATGIACAVRVVLPSDGRSTGSRWAAAGAGGCAMAALLVKQNLADVAVFALVTWLVARRNRQLGGRQLGRALGAAVAGGLATLGLVSLWTVLHGTSLVGVFDAMYPFRIQAARVLAAGSSQAAEGRLAALVGSWALSATPLLMVAFAWLVLRRRVRGPVVWGLMAAMVYGVVSVLLGGSYWLHYLAQLVPVTAIIAGVVASHDLRLGRRLPALVVGCAAVALVALVFIPRDRAGADIGTWIGRSASPGDTVVSAFGNADLVQASRLDSPYPYLWSLPAHTLDPDLTALRATLAGAAPPIWFVVRGPTTYGQLKAADIVALLNRDYRVVGRACGRIIYLRQGTTRPALDRQQPCA